MPEAATVAWIGVIGAVIGSVSTLAAQWLLHYLGERAQKKRDEPRRALLMQMLEDKRFEWRELSTLQNVIGADEETTKRLLISMGARASEDGKPIWALLARKPLPSIQ